MGNAPRHGFALLVVLATIAVVTALSTATYLRVREESRAARRTPLAIRARDAAERALWELAATIDATTFRYRPTGSTMSREIVEDDGRAVATAMVAGAGYVWIVAESRYGRAGEQGSDRVALSAEFPSDTTRRTLTTLPGAAWVPLY